MRLAAAAVVACLLLIAAAFEDGETRPLGPLDFEPVPQLEALPSQTADRVAPAASAVQPDPDGDRSEAPASCGDDRVLVAAKVTLCPQAPRFADADADGEHDATDLCPSTEPGAEVDTAGCSQAQFCGTVAVQRWRDARLCRFVDWRNDETFRRPEDCLLADTGSGWACVARAR